MLTNDQLSTWDRESLFHPSTDLGRFARGEAPQRIIRSAEVSTSSTATATDCWTALPGSIA